MKRAGSSLLLALAALALSAGLDPAMATLHCGPVCDETWLVADNPHVLSCDAYVPAACYLNIEAGVEVRGQGPTTTLEVRGTLDVNGTSAFPVYFTSDMGSPSTGDWAGITIIDDGTATMDHADVTYADNGIHLHDNASLVMDSVLLQYNGKGLWAEETTQVTATGCRITGNTGTGVSVGGPPDVTISGSSLHSNGGDHDVSTYGDRPETAVLMARNNWWGTTDTGVIRSRIYDWIGVIDWCDYLDGPPPTGLPARDAHCPDLIVCDETAVWDQTDRPYLVVGELDICPTGTLQIGAGVEVRVAPTDPQVEFWVNGALDVQGTAASPVLIASDSATPQAGDWEGIDVWTGSSASVSHASILHADQGFYVHDATLVLDTVELRENGIGLWAIGVSSVDASSCKFTENLDEGVFASLPAGSTFTVRHSALHGNYGDADVSASGSEGYMDARENWWGTTDPALIAARVSDVAPVDWCRYLDGPPPSGVPALDLHCPELLACNGTVVWDLTDRPYHLVSDAVVCPTGTLQIGPGVEVRAVAGGSSGFEVKGTLHINGTEPSPVVLTSDSPSPQPEDWSGVKFTSGSVGTLDHVEILYALNGIDIDDTTTLTLDHLTARWNQTGLNCFLGPSDPVVTVTATNCKFTDNEYHGASFNEYYLAPVPDPTVSITGSSLHSNGQDDFVAGWGISPETVFDLRDNWWGTTDPSAIANNARVLTAVGRGAAADWCRFRSSEGGPPVLDAHCPDLRVCGESGAMNLTDKPYQLVGDMVVCPTGTLTVGPGVELRAEVNGDLPAVVVEGLLDVNGAPGTPVVFTSNAAVPNPADWGGLQLIATGTATVDEAEITYADTAVTVGDGAGATLDGVTARLGNTGIYVAGDATPTLNAQGCTIVDNQLYGVEVHGTSGVPDPVVSIGGSSIHGNLATHDVYAATDFVTPGATVIEARGNWWGTDDTTLISQRIYDNNDNTGSAHVEWCAYLDGPGGTAPDVECPDSSICNDTVVWDRTDRPYQITGDIEICPTGVLQVEPGVEVRFVKASPVLTFLIDGRLEINGTQASPVLFTSDSQTPATGDWSGLRFQGVLASELSWGTVEYGNTGVYTDDDNTLTLHGMTLRHNINGISARSTDGRPTINADSCRFVDNTDNGIYIYEAIYHAYPLVTVHQSELHGNAYQFNAAGMSYPYTKVYDFRENWWGSADPDVFGPGIFDYRKHDQRPLVDWCRYLDGPGGNPVVDAHCPDLSVCDETVTLDLTDKPYQVTSDLYVCDTGTLNVSPGVTVMVAAGTPLSDIQVHGALNVNGTGASPVVFTSDAPVAQPADWTGLYLASSSISGLQHAEISHADNGVRLNNSALATLTDVKSYQNIDGVYVFGWGPPTAIINHSQLVDNDRYGLRAGAQTGRPNPFLTVNQSAIHSNRGDWDYYYYPATAPTKTVVNARDNWWGTPDPAAIGPRIYDHRRRDGSPIVDWCGWLDAFDGTAVVESHCPHLAPCDETIVLTQTDLPYLLTSDMIVCNTGTLQVEPGVELRTVVTTFEPEFIIEGVLDVNGTPASPVVFTPDSASPQTGDWIGLQFRGSSTGNLDHAEVLWADRGLDLDNSSSVTLDGVSARHNYDGVHVNGYGPPSLTATGSTFTDNTRYGIIVNTQTGRPNPTIVVNNSSLHSNGGDDDFYFYPATAATRTVVDARDNWWGADDPEVVGSRIYDHRSRDGAPLVDFCGWLDGPGGVVVRESHCPDLAPCNETVVLDQTDLPYLLTSDLIVCDTGVLQIEPGVEVQNVITTPRSDFLVEGVLDVNGTRVEPVTLTVDSASPAVGDWYGVVLGATSNSTLDHAVVQWADHGVEVTGGATVALREVTLSHNYDGLWVQGYGQQTVAAAGCTFTDNDRYGIFTRHIMGFPNPDLTVTRSSIHSNLGAYDLYTNDFGSAATSIVWATDNWWGTTDEAEIELRIHDNDDGSAAPHVYYKAFGDTCDMALGGDLDGDGLSDFEDNCPVHANLSQYDFDGDGMGDPCDPRKYELPTAPCDGNNDLLKFYADTDKDGWGDPCDPNPCRDDSYPGAPELCDGRDNDCDGFLGAGEKGDEDLDFGLVCGDCDDLEPLANVCGCEVCGNVLDDDCDGFADLGDSECIEAANCVVLTSGADPWLDMGKGECGGATLSGPYDVLRGDLLNLAFDAGHVDLGAVECVQGAATWDRVTDWSLDPDPRCATSPGQFYLGRNTGDFNFGWSSTGDPRDVMTPDPVCP